MSRRVIIIGVLLLVAVGLWRRDHLASSRGPERDERDHDVGLVPTETSGTEGEHAGSARPAAGPRIEAGALRLEGLVLDDEERPVGGAKVTLDSARTTVTEADGSFAFDDLAPRDYTVIAELGEWYGEETDATLDEDSDPVTIEMTRGPTLRVHVVGTSGRPIAGASIDTSSREVVTDAAGIGFVRGVDIGTDYVRVEAAGHAKTRQRVVTGDDPKVVIEVKVVLMTGAPLAGTVVDEDGRPVANALIELEAPNGERVDSASSDDAGVWTSENTAAGTFMVRATSAAHVATRDIVVVHDGLATKTDIVVRVARGGEVIGIVVDSGGKPVAGAQVSIGRRRVETGGDGRFVASGIEPDRYDAIATTEHGASASKVVVVKATGRSEIELVVHSSTIAGVVVDTDGLPIEDVMVYARSQDPNGHGLGYSDEHGKFDLGGIPPGTYVLEAQRAEQATRVAAFTAEVRSGTRTVRIVLPELASIAGRVVLDGVPVPYFGVAVSAAGESIESQSPRAVREATGTFVERGLGAGTWTVAIVGPGFERKVIENVQLTAGETKNLGDIVVGPGELVAGRVVDEHGRGVHGATVTVLNESAGSDTDRLRGMISGSYSATTDAHGAFRIQGLRASERRTATATHPTHGVSGEHTLQPGQRDVELLLHATGSLVGSLANLTPEVRVHGVFASVVDGPGGSQQVDVDSSGRYEFANLPAGEYQVRVRGQVVVPTQRVTVVAGVRAELDFKLPLDPVTLIVQVTGECSLLWLNPRGSAESLEYESCSSGPATFRGVPAGSYDICFSGSDCRSIEVPPQREVTVQIAAQS